MENPADPRPGDVPLAEAMLVWSPSRKLKPRIKVERRGFTPDFRYFLNWGFGTQEFRDADDAGKLLMLFQQFHQLILWDKLPAQEVHKALLTIPEYRCAILWNLLDDER